MAQFRAGLQGQISRRGSSSESTERPDESRDEGTHIGKLKAAQIAGVKGLCFNNIALK